MPAEETIDDLEQMLRYDARRALAITRDRLDAFGTDSDNVTYQRLLLIKGAAQARIGDTEDGARVTREVTTWAEDHDEPALLALCHRRLSALFRRVGDPALMLEHAVIAVDLLDESTPEAVRGDHLLGLADALGASGDFDDSIRRYHEAMALATSCGDRYLERAVLNNLSYTQYEAGLSEEAVATAELLVAEAAADDVELMTHNADTVARAYTAVGRYADAAAVIEPRTAEIDLNEDCDAVVMGLLTLTEVHRLSAAFDESQRTLDRAVALVDEYALTGRRIEAMRAQAELHAARGDYKQAFETFRDFHDSETELRALERDGRARTLNAIFEATEARRSSDYFRELSVRDPLTGMHNRRHLDAQLAELLDEVERAGTTLTIGLVDLDHFKRINDTRSHATGDELLRQVAQLLQAAAEAVPGGLAARMGGEEFLILLPGVDRSTGVKMLEELRLDIAGHDWSAVSEGVSVTASIGVASAPDDHTERAALLATADGRLYAAKDGGRDRVVS